VIPMALSLSNITRVWLVRHGEPHPDIRGRCYGSTDAGLSDSGRAQAKQVGRALKDESLSIICTSPRARAWQTAAAIAEYHQCPVQMDERLREIDFGDLEGQRYEDIARLYPSLYRQWMEHPTTVQFPNGECFDDVRQRVLTATNGLLQRHRGETIAIVAHGGVNRIVLAEALGMPGENLFRIAQAYGARNLIQYIGDYPSVEVVNVVPPSN